MFHVKRAAGAHRTCKDVGHRKGAGLQPPAGGTVNHIPTSRARARSITSCTAHDVDPPCNCAGRVCLGMPPSHPSPTADAPSAVRDVFACRAPRSNREGKTRGHVGSHPTPGGTDRRHRIARPRVAEVTLARPDRPSPCCPCWTRSVRHAARRVTKTRRRQVLPCGEIRPLPHVECSPPPSNRRNFRGIAVPCTPRQAGCFT